MNAKIIKSFLRLSIAAGFLSAVADRLGWWGPEKSAWGNWEAFTSYTHSILPWFSLEVAGLFGLVATIAEVLFAICLLIGFKTQVVALCSGFLLLAFALAMTFSVGIKAPFDYSVYAASSAAFGLSLINERFLEVDMLIAGKYHGALSSIL